MIRQLRDQFMISYGDYYRVIVFDEAHGVSNAAQNALLKVLEEAQGRIFFVMATTETNKLLPTIRSRSLELDFKKVPRDSIIDNLTKVSERKGIPLSDEIKGIIADRAEGHMRNAHMLVDKYLLLGEEDFKISVRSAIELYCGFFSAIKQNNKVYISGLINLLLNIPMEDLHSDWNTIMVESMKAFNGIEITNDTIKQFVDLYGRESFKLVITGIYFAPWTNKMFLDMPYFQATMLNIYAILNKHFYPPVVDDSKKKVQDQQNQRNVLIRR